MGHRLDDVLLRDVGEVLRAARARAGFGQRVLAQRAGLSRTMITRYESGAVSPTVATVDRLLAACGLQGRIRLEPLMADVDARVDALLAGEPRLEQVYALPELIRTLEDHPDAQHGGFSRRSRTGRDRSRGRSTGARRWCCTGSR